MGKCMTNCAYRRELVTRHMRQSERCMHATVVMRPVSQCKQHLLWLQRAGIQALKFKHWHNNMRSTVLSWLTSSSSSSSAKESFDVDETLARFACFSSLTWAMHNRQESAAALSQYYKAHKGTVAPAVPYWLPEGQPVCACLDGQLFALAESFASQQTRLVLQGQQFADQSRPRASTRTPQGVKTT